MLVKNIQLKKETGKIDYFCCGKKSYKIYHFSHF